MSEYEAISQSQNNEPIGEERAPVERRAEERPQDEVAFHVPRD